jgi:hypothetical protein
MLRHVACQRGRPISQKHLKYLWAPTERRLYGHPMGQNICKGGSKEKKVLELMTLT